MNKKAKFVGAGAGLVAMAAGGYFLYGKDGAKNREKVRGWALKARGEMLEKIEKLKAVNRETYESVIETVAARYKKFKEVDRKELARLVKESKGYWNSIVRRVPAKTEAVKTAKAGLKKARKHAKAKAQA